MAIKQIVLLSQIGLQVQMSRMASSMHLQVKYPPHDGHYVTQAEIDDLKASAVRAEQDLNVAIAEGWLRWDVTPPDSQGYLNVILYKPDAEVDEPPPSKERLFMDVTESQEVFRLLETLASIYFNVWGEPTREYQVALTKDLLKEAIHTPLREAIESGWLVSSWKWPDSGSVIVRLTRDGTPDE